MSETAKNLVPDFFIHLNYYPSTSGDSSLWRDETEKIITSDKLYGVVFIKEDVFDLNNQDDIDFLFGLMSGRRDVQFVINTMHADIGIDFLSRTKWSSWNKNIHISRLESIGVNKNDG